MTTARDWLNKFLGSLVAGKFLDEIVKAPDAVRQELAELLCPCPWQPMNTRPYRDDPMWFARWDGKYWNIDGPRGAKYDDADYFDYWAPCETPHLPAPPKKDKT